MSANTIGLLVDWLEDDYQNAFLGAVAREAREAGANLIVFCGGIIGSQQPQFSLRNAAFDLARAPAVDGLVLLSGTIGNAIGPAALAQWCERLRPLPLASVAVELPGMPSVQVDNSSGLRDGLLHLLDFHGYRRVAFIRGPEANDEAERRYKVYRDTLAAREIALDPALVLDGNFQRAAGLAAVRALLERQVKFDAVVAANDHMALGAALELQAHDIVVPDQVAVMGFDDVEEARFSSPPLTTVRQPLLEQARHAAKLVLAQLRGETVPEHIVLRTELLTRASCGCVTGMTFGARAEHHSRAHEPFAAAVAKRKHDIAEAMVEAARDTAVALPPTWALRVLEAFSSEVSEGLTGICLSAFAEVLRRVALTSTDVGLWQGVVTALRRRSMPLVEADREQRARAEDLWHEMRVLVSDAAERSQAQQRLAVVDSGRAMWQTSEALVAQLELPSLLETITSQLTRLGVPSWYLALRQPLHQAPSGNETPDEEQLELAVAHDPSRPEASSELASMIGQRMAADQLIPRLLPKDGRRVFVVEPLFFADRQLGVALLEMGPRDGRVYESLRNQMSAALERVRLLSKALG